MSIFSVIGRVAGGAAKGILTGNPVSAVTGAIGSIPTPSQPRSPAVTNQVVPGRCSSGFLLTPSGECSPLAPSVPGGGGGGRPCPTGTVLDPGTGYCVSPKSPVGEKYLADQYGEAVVGRYGAALVPAERMTSVARCPPGAVVGKDGLCYNKHAIRNSDRRWPAPTKPLLTGGELRAISTASRAAGKLTRKTKQLQKLGLMKKPARRRAS